MANFARLQELADAENSNNLTDAMSVYIQREINADLQFPVGLSHLWDMLYSRVNKRRLLTTELNVFGVSIASPVHVRTHFNHTAEDDLEVFSADDLGLDLISALNFPHVL
ncbi:hypothetical protein Tco_1323285 [Tanacetum coccineum]